MSALNGLQELVTLGKTELQIPPMGVGTWAWGDRMIWGYGRDYHDEDIHQAFTTSLEAGITFFDTAEVYGMGKSERLLGSYLPSASSPVIVATKFFPFPWRLSRGALLRALQSSLKRLNMDSVDLYQVHWPYPPVSIETWASALADVVEQGLARAVGVSNYSESQMHRAYTVLAKRGVPLASNQVEYSLLNRKVEFNGLLKACKDLGITLIAYSPLGQGLLTGKYSPAKPPQGLRSTMYSRAYLEKIQLLVQKLREIGRLHDGKSPAQVALNWLICKGSVPIPGAKNERQALENSGALGWRLTEEEVDALDEASASIS